MFVAGVYYSPKTRTLFFLPGITEFMFTVRILEGSMSSRNRTFCRTILSTVATGGERFGINQVKAIGIISPDFTGMCMSF